MTTYTTYGTTSTGGRGGTMTVRGRLPSGPTQLPHPQGGGGNLDHGGGGGVPEPGTYTHIYIYIYIYTYYKYLISANINHEKFPPGCLPENERPFSGREQLIWRRRWETAKGAWCTRCWFGEPLKWGCLKMGDPHVTITMGFNDSILSHGLKDLDDLGGSHMT